MNPDPSSYNVVARYKPNTSGYNAVILISGLALAGIVGYRMLGQSTEERLVSLAMMGCFVFGTVVFAGVFWTIKIHTVEVTTSGTMDFVSRIKRDSHPRNTLLRVEGHTTRSAKGDSRSHWADFVFAGDGQSEIKRNIGVPAKLDPELQEFVRKIEKTNPKVDTSKFWAWINE